MTLSETLKTEFLELHSNYNYNGLAEMLIAAIIGEYILPNVCYMNNNSVVIHLQSKEIRDLKEEYIVNYL